MFEIGDIVICINNKKLHSSASGQIPPLKLNGEYVLQEMKECSLCQHLMFDVGISSINDTSVCVCMNKYPSTGIWWVSSTRFRKKAPAIELSNVTIEDLINVAEEV